VVTGSSYIIISKKFIFKKNSAGVPDYLFPPVTATAYMAWFAALEMAIAAFVKSFFDPRLFSGLDKHVRYFL
jgi:hypothetical protein